MVKQIVVTVMLLLIHDVPKAIQYTWAILDFTILAQCVLYDNKMLCYMKHELYRLEKSKIVFKHYWSINSKLYWPTFNYLKFNAISYIVLCIWDYGGAINNNTAHSEATHKYLLKAYYNRTNKKEYNLQIWQHNICYSNIFAMMDVIIEEKAREKKRLSDSITDTTALAELTQALRPADLTRKYMWAMSNVYLDVVKELGLTSMKKY